MSKWTPKNPKTWHNTPVFLCWHEKKYLKAISGNGYRFVPKVGTFPTENHHACCEKLWFVRSISLNLPQMGQKNYHDMLMPLHDSMPSSKNFRRVLDSLEFKNHASQCFTGNQWCSGVWNSFPFLAWDLSMNPRTHISFSTNLYALEQVHVVQIWIMHIHALKTQLMHKNAQMNPKKSQRLTQLSCCSMLTRENFWKQ